MAKSEAAEFYNGLIANVGGNGKFLEFLDAMTEPYLKDYAALQGAIGNKYAPNAGIRVTITEYGKDNKMTGSGSALLPTYIFSEIDRVCLMNTGVPVLSDDAVRFVTALSRLCDGAVTLGKEGVGAVAEIIKGGASPLMAVGKALKLANYALRGLEDDGKTPKEAPTVTPPLLGYNYDYSQVRIHSGNQGKNGTCHCSTVSIKRQASMPNSKTGRNEPSKYPWLITVSGFYAKPVKTATGGENYDSRTVTDKTEQTFRASDRDMHRCAEAVSRFVLEWDRSILTLFMQGRAETQFRQDEYRQKQADRYVC